MSDTQLIKDKLDIAQIIGEYVPLKKAGINFKANCPFHREKTPSFMVQPEKQIWHCFGCGKGGDIFSFVQEIEGMDFPETLKLLAARAGVKLTNTFENEVSKSQKNRILEINNAAANFFHRFLLEMSAAKPARDYLERRQLTTETIKNWQIGFITDQWDLLTQYLLKKGFGIDDLVASGLTIKKDPGSATPSVATPGKSASIRGCYDRFRGRVMFPIWDTHGQVVGFTGRILVETENSGGKYVNTPQTLAYDKSRVLYGLDKAKIEIKAHDLVVVVEGQMDVIACHQAGMKNVVAASGTALTPEQVRLIKRYTNNVSMAFDADAAGENAGKRGADIAVTEGLNVKIIRVPDGAGKDADEVIKKNKNVWLEAVKNAQSVMEWNFDAIMRKFDTRNPRTKQKAMEAMVIEIARIPYSVERDEWLKKAAEKLDVDMNMAREELKKVGKKLLTGQNKNNIDGKEDEIAPAQTHIGRAQIVAEQFWALILKFPELYGGLSSSLQSDYFLDTDFVTLYEMAQKQYNESNQVTLEFLRTGSVGAMHSLDILLLRADKDFEELRSEDAHKELINLLHGLEDLWKTSARKILLKKISEAEKTGDKAQMEELLKKLQTI